MRLFRGARHEPDLAADGQSGLHRALTRRYDALDLGRGPSAIEGPFSSLARLRRSDMTVPALVLTALGLAASGTDLARTA
ncbi:hypothetical protein Acy02nite_55720 [Actinoplanes cyaneus]|uniref:Uncharacterized protein n=1 Tax=Actinoplanes cyaneus TaxID=52696 RepID=A0A919IN14_9ACTN|nr:hypothetical protein [Actinoplanes cyaneus]GID67691.1 hypothetical protein Acy02nite_55720 [Actinoplanes cyaneus]